MSGRGVALSGPTITEALAGLSAKMTTVLLGRGRGRVEKTMASAIVLTPIQSGVAQAIVIAMRSVDVAPTKGDQETDGCVQRAGGVDAVRPSGQHRHSGLNRS